MAKTAVKQHEKRVDIKICSKCKGKIKPIGIILKGATKMAKSCDCGIFIGTIKIQ